MMFSVNINRFFLLFTIFLALVHSLQLNDPNDLKPCFERYNGHKLVAGVQPFHSEWRIQSEEFCLEFCVRASSRCASIVFDKAKHICHYFSHKAAKSSDVQKYRKFVYLQVTTSDCLDKILAQIGSGNTHQEMPKNESLSQANEQTPKNNGESSEKEQTKSGNSMSAIFDRIDAELWQEQQKQNSEPNPTLIPAIVQQFEMPKMEAKKAIPLTEREIRRHPRIGLNMNQMESEGKMAWDSILTGAWQAKNSLGEDLLHKEQIPAGKTVEKEEEENCDPDSSIIWLAIENSLHKEGPQTIPERVETPRECIGLCKNAMINARPCNAFTFIEHQKTCNLTHSGNDFLNGLIQIPNANFSHRAFRRFCFSASLSPFTGCSEFLSFTDYRLELEPREKFDGLPQGSDGVSACIELCVLSNEFQCMSAHFDISKGICRLFDTYSLSSPRAFQSHQEPGQLYFENGCIDSAKEFQKN